MFALSRLARPPACSASIDVLACDAVATKGLAAIFVPFVPATKSGRNLGELGDLRAADTATGWHRWLAWISFSTEAEVAADKAAAAARKTATFQ